jgi:integrase/recombinase XerD
LSITCLNRPDISQDSVRLALPYRKTPYFQLVAYGRHLGYMRSAMGDAWYARIRTRAESYYRRRLGLAATPSNPEGLTFDQALVLAKEWFKSSGIKAWASDAKAIGVSQQLVVSPIGEIYCVAHAMHDYVEWKRLVAAKSHFETNLASLNYHIIPRLAHIPLSDFNGDHLRRFVRDVMETPPKRGNRPLSGRVSIASLDDEQLRKRKKTVNTLIGILRVAFQLAWENGKTDSERSWRCLRRVPAVDRPRTLHLSRLECRELLASCRPDLARLVLGALYTGCRSVELMNMRCEDVGRDGYGVYVAPSKKFRPRFVFLPDEGMAWFLDLVKGRKRQDFVFIRDSGKPWYGNHKHLFKAAAREAGLPEEFSFHGLRHTYASQLIQAGATVYAVAGQLGHADPTTVLRTYGHLSPQIREAEVRQRFTPVSIENDEAAHIRVQELAEWRGSLHGSSDWREYAKINDVWDPERSLDFSRLPRIGSRLDGER